jgi:acetylornithine deacetylase/succinyl-diaminopimelate desuccinylase-like protein
MINTNILPKEEIIAFCQKLIQTPSVNGVDNELAVAKVIDAFARENGFASELIALEAERPSVLVKYGPDDVDAGLLLVAHIDTVPVGSEQNWKYPPFSGQIVENRLYGRGAIDNKGGIASAMAALILLKTQAAAQLKRPVHLAFVPDEESGATGRLGIKYLQEKNKLSGRGAIYTYPIMAEIEIGHRGVLRLNIETLGRSMHTGFPAWQNSDRSANAVTGMAEILLKLEKLRFDAPPVDPAFAKYETVITPTIINGGAGQSITPDICKAMIDIRTVPSVPRETIETAINEIIEQVKQNRPELDVHISTHAYLPSTVIPGDSKIIQAIKTATKEVLGKESWITVAGPANESYLLNSYGIPTITCGPDGEGAHSVNEYVIIDSLFQTAEIYARVALLLSED